DGSHFPDLGRDRESYSTRNSSKGALVPEAHAVFSALASGASLEEVRRSCLDGSLLRQSAQATRQRVWALLHWRFFAWSPPAWVLQDISRAAREGITSPVLLGLLYLHSARRDRLTFDFVTEALWARWNSGARLVSRGDVLDFLREREAPEVALWRESTREKVA